MAGFNPGPPPQAPQPTPEKEEVAPDQTQDDRTTVEIINALKSVSEQVGILGQMVQAMQESMNTPAEIIRDENNRPVAVRKGGKIQQIVRDENGRAIGTTPMPNR